MMEHPEQYSDAQLQELLSDEECRELYEVMRLSASAFEAEDARQKIAEGIKEEEIAKRLLPIGTQEWKKFENLELRVESLEFPTGLQRDSSIHYPLLKLAAAFIGLLMLSGITYAAIHIARHHQRTEAVAPADTKAVANSKLSTLNSKLPQDSIPQMRIFENAPLDEMVSEIATYYNKVADIQNEQAHELRLYYKWEPQQPLESIIEDLNHFDRVNLAIEDDKLIVK